MPRIMSVILIIFVIPSFLKDTITEYLSNGKSFLPKEMK
jgi:hypothetical protein